MSPSRPLAGRRTSPAAAARLLLPLLLPALGPPSGAQDAAAGEPEPVRVLELTLDEAVEIALRNNLALDIQEIRTDVALFDAVGSWGAFDPRIGATVAVSDNESPVEGFLTGAEGNVLTENTQSASASVTFPFTSGGDLEVAFSRSNRRTNSVLADFDTSTRDVLAVTLTQPLLRGAWRRFATTDQRAAELAHQREVAAEGLVRRQLVRDVYVAYWSLVSAIEQLAVNDLSVQLAQEQLDQERKRLDVGAGTGVDVLQAQASLAVQQEARVLATFNLRDAEDALRSLLVRPRGNELDDYLEQWDWPIRPTTGLPDVETAAEAEARLDWRRSLQGAVASRPELLQARIDVDSAEVSLERAVSDRRPLLDLSLSAAGTGFDPDPAEAFSRAAGYEFPQLSGSLFFSMPVPNRTARNAERAARALVRQARLAYDQAEMGVVSEIRRAVRQVRYAAEQVAATRTTLDFAQRQLEAERSRQSIGTSTTFQVLQLQEDYTQALSAERVARSAYARALAELAYAEGALDARSDPGDVAPEPGDAPPAGPPDGGGE